MFKVTARSVTQQQACACWAESLAQTFSLAPRGAHGEHGQQLSSPSWVYRAGWLLQSDFLEFWGHLLLAWSCGADIAAQLSGWHSCVLSSTPAASFNIVDSVFMTLIPPANLNSISASTILDSLHYWAHGKLLPYLQSFSSKWKINYIISSNLFWIIKLLSF